MRDLRWVVLLCVLNLFLPSLSFPQVWLVSSPENEGGFGVKVLKDKVCFVGRRFSPETLYDALLGVKEDDRFSFFLWETSGDDMVYAVEVYGKGCVALVVTTARGNMDLALVGFNGGTRTLRFLGTDLDEMMWFVRKVPNGYILVGGVKERDWDIWVLLLDGELNILKSLRMGTGGNEYAYSVAYLEGKYYLVGRTDYRGNWDGFYLVLGEDLRPLKSKIVGTDGKDYFRYVGVFGGRVIAVGRTEKREDSDLLLFSVGEGTHRVYDVGSLDYGRVILERPYGFLVLGETETNGDREGLVLSLDQDLEPLRAYLFGGEGVESIRHAEGDIFVGYSYSFSLTGDLFLGVLRRGCGRVFRPTPVLHGKTDLSLLPMPLGVMEHPVQDLKVSSKTRRVHYKPVDLCQE